MDDLNNQGDITLDPEVQYDTSSNSKRENADILTEKSAAWDVGATCPAPGHRFVRSVSAGIDKQPQIKRSSGSIDELSDSELVEERALDVDQLKTFVIPKRKKAKKELFEDVELTAREFTQDIRSILSRSYKDPLSETNFKYTRVQLIHNTELEEAFLERRKKFRSDGYSEKETHDSYAFLFLTSETEAKTICKEGVQKGNSPVGCIGHPEMGVCLTRHADVLRMTSMGKGMQGKLIIFKIIKGKVKPTVENKTTAYIEPTPNFDCHISKTPVVLSSMTSRQAFESSQIYLYEYNEDLDLETRPGQICPYALLDVTYTGDKPQKGLKTTPQQVFASPKIPPKSPRSSTECVVQDSGQYRIWTGQLAMKGGHSCQAEMMSYNSFTKPARIGNQIYLGIQISFDIIENTFLPGLKQVVKDKTMTIEERSVNYCQMLPCRQNEAKFERFFNVLKKSQKGILVKLEHHRLIVLASGDLTAKLGLQGSNRHVLHCLFVSNRSRTGDTENNVELVLPEAKSDIMDYDAGGFTPPSKSPVMHRRPLLSISKVFGIKDYIHVTTGPHGDVDYRNCEFEFEPLTSTPEGPSTSSRDKPVIVQQDKPSQHNNQEESPFHDPPKLIRTVLEDPFDTGFISYLPEKALVNQVRATELLLAQSSMQKKRNIAIAKGEYKMPDPKGIDLGSQLARDTSPPVSVEGPSKKSAVESFPHVVVSLPLSHIDMPISKPVESKLPAGQTTPSIVLSPISTTSFSSENLDATIGYQCDNGNLMKSTPPPPRRSSSYDGATRYRSECSNRATYEDVYASMSDIEQFGEVEPITLQDFHKSPSDTPTQPRRSRKRHSIRSRNGTRQTRKTPGLRITPHQLKNGKAISSSSYAVKTDLSDMVRSFLEVSPAGEEERALTEGLKKQKMQKVKRAQKCNEVITGKMIGTDKQLTRNSQPENKTKETKNPELKPPKTLQMFDFEALLVPQIPIYVPKKKKKSKRITSEGKKHKSPKSLMHDETFLKLVDDGVAKRGKNENKTLSKNSAERGQIPASLPSKSKRKVSAKDKKMSKIKSWVEANRDKKFSSTKPKSLLKTGLTSFKIPKKAANEPKTSSSTCTNAEIFAASQKDDTKEPLIMDTYPSDHDSVSPYSEVEPVIDLFENPGSTNSINNPILDGPFPLNTQTAIPQEQTQCAGIGSAVAMTTEVTGGDNSGAADCPSEGAVDNCLAAAGGSSGEPMSYHHSLREAGTSPIRPLKKRKPRDFIDIPCAGASTDGLVTAPGGSMKDDSEVGSLNIASGGASPDRSTMKRGIMCSKDMGVSSDGASPGRPIVMKICNELVCSEDMHGGASPDRPTTMKISKKVVCSEDMRGGASPNQPTTMKTSTEILCSENMHGGASPDRPTMMKISNEIVCSEDMCSGASPDRPTMMKTSNETMYSEDMDISSDGASPDRPILMRTSSEIVRSEDMSITCGGTSADGHITTRTTCNGTAASEDKNNSSGVASRNRPTTTTTCYGVVASEDQTLSSTYVPADLLNVVSLRVKTRKFLNDISKRYGFFTGEVIDDPDTGDVDPLLFVDNSIVIGDCLDDMQITLSWKGDYDGSEAVDLSDCVVTMLHKQFEMEDNDHSNDEELLNSVSCESLHFKNYKGKQTLSAFQVNSSQHPDPRSQTRQISLYIKDTSSVTPVKSADGLTPHEPIHLHSTPIDTLDVTSSASSVHHVPIHLQLKQTREADNPLNLPFGPNWQKRLASEFDLTGLQGLTEVKLPEDSTALAQKSYATTSSRNESIGISSSPKEMSEEVKQNTNVPKCTLQNAVKASGLNAGRTVEVVSTLDKGSVNHLQLNNDKVSVETKAILPIIDRKPVVLSAPYKKPSHKPSRQFHPYKRETVKTYQNQKHPDYYNAARDLNELMQNMTETNYLKKCKRPLLKVSLNNMIRHCGRGRFNSYSFKKHARTEQRPISPNDLEDLPMTKDQIPDFEERRARAMLLDESKGPAGDVGHEDDLERSFYEDRYTVKECAATMGVFMNAAAPVDCDDSPSAFNVGARHIRH